MGDAISHAVLPGISASFLLGIGYFPGALVAGLITASAISVIQQNSKIKSDTAIGIIFTAMFALGVIMISLSPSSTDLTNILFGNLLTVKTSDMIITLVVGGFVLSVITVLYQPLKISTFDPQISNVYGISTKLMHVVLMLLLTFVTVASLQTVGIILVVAMLITPAATAHIIAKRLETMILFSILFGVLSSVTGLAISYQFNVPSGAAIVLVSATLFLIVFLFSPTSGVIPRKLRRQQRTKIQPSTMSKGTL